MSPIVGRQIVKDFFDTHGKPISSLSPSEIPKCEDCGQRHISILTINGPCKAVHVFGTWIVLDYMGPISVSMNMAEMESDNYLSYDAMEKLNEILEGLLQQILN